MDKKIILVTGANRGIGLEIVRQSARLGNQVFLGSRDRLKGEQAVEMLASEGIRADFIQLDVMDGDQVNDAFNKIKSEVGQLDVLINNAGIMMKQDHSILDAADPVLERIIRTNSIAPLRLSQKFASIIPKGGRIIMMSSGGGSMTDPVQGWSPVYCVSKSMLNSITRHLANELGLRGILVNAMCPGWVRSDMGGKSAPRSIEQGADTAVWLATAELKETGKFWRDRKQIPW
jgi:NAD(P)-dependent dehydrogenase (short-subunit alcohol dehydrogenase family)